MKAIRVSEVGTYHYCQRAWWYQINGVDPGNIEELSKGIQLHEGHGRAVFGSGCLRILAIAFLLLSITMLCVYIIQQVINL
jgi:hypothetical protein